MQSESFGFRKNFSSVMSPSTREPYRMKEQKGWVWTYRLRTIC